MTVRNTISVKARTKELAGLLIKSAFVLLLVSLPETMFAQTKSNKGKDLSDESLINQYIQSKNGSIIFDASNIKQFWISNSVAGINNNINIALNNKNTSFESIPLRIQLANVGVIQDCTIDVIAETPGATFTIADANLKSLASSVTEDDFLHYHVYSSSFHLADTQDFSFNLIFRTENENYFSAKKIILSFSQNGTFLSSPGTLRLSKDNGASTNSAVKEAGEHAFSLTGTNSIFLSQNNVLVGDNTITSSVTVKNIGDTPTTVSVGYTPYTASGIRMDNRISLYNKSNKVLKVISSEANSNKIIVDDYPEWTKGCFVALNAKEDLSDFPNCSFIDQPVASVNKNEEGQVEIVFDKPLKTPIAKDSLVRVQSPLGSSYIYVNSKRLQPGEEATLTSSIEKDDDLFQFSAKSLWRGVYYIKPIIRSYSVENTKENTVLITDFTINY